MGSHLGFARCLGGCQGVLGYSGLDTRALLSVCIVAMVFLWYSGGYLGVARLSSR